MRYLPCIVLSCILIMTVIFPGALSANGGVLLRAHGSLMLHTTGSGIGMDVDLSFGGKWRFLLTRMILRWEYEEPAHLVNMQFALSGIFSFRKHSLFAGVQAGRRTFRMDYSWKRWLYGFHAGYEFWLNTALSLGVEYRFNAIEGSPSRDNAFIIIPAFYF